MSSQGTSLTTRVGHKFLDHKIDPQTIILIVGTFNPSTPENNADFFYSSPRNQLWSLLPQAFGLPDLQGKDRVTEKKQFMKDYHIDFIDIISAVDVEKGQECNRKDAYIDSRICEWRDVIQEMKQLKFLRRACFTRKGLKDIPRMKAKIDEIREYCRKSGTIFEGIVTPSQAFRSRNKQSEWTQFFNPPAVNGA